MNKESAGLLASVDLVPVEAMIDSGDVEVWVCRRKRAQKHSRIAVIADGEIRAVVPDARKASLVIPYTKRVLAERFVLFSNAPDDIVAGVSSYDLKNDKLAKGFFRESRMNVFGFDVDPSGRYAIFGYIVEDPDFPLIRVFDGIEESWIEINTDDLIDAPIRDFEHNIRWSDTLDEIELCVPNVDTYKDEWRAMPFDMDARTVQWTA